MRTKRSTSLTLMCGLATVLSSSGCNMVIGLNKLSVAEPDDAGSNVDPNGSADADAFAMLPPDAETPDAAAPECTTNAECTDRATMAGIDAGAMGEGGAPFVAPAVCLKPDGQCVELLNMDCTSVVGDYRNDDAILLGTLFTTKGTQAATNLLRQQSAAMAALEINAAGGLPPSTAGGNSRPLVMVSCDESTDLVRAAKHLVTDLRVPAIVGPNTSQDTLDVSTKVTIQSGTLVMTPTAVASSISDLSDDGLTWLMVPSDVQRAPLMIEQINELESSLKVARSETNIKLGIIFRNDALGIGTRTSLNALVLNGKPLADPINAGNTASGNVRIEPYDSKQTDFTNLLNEFVAFAPDIIVLAGTAEAVTSVMNPLELAWKPTVPKPYYVVIDSVKVPDLITAAANSDLRKRVRGTGVPGLDSTAVSSAFKLDYISTFGTSPTTSGMGPSYDATYSIAYALAAIQGQPVSGANLAQGLRKLANGNTAIDVGPVRLLAAFKSLSGGDSISATGTFGPLEWDTNGAVVGGSIEMWCIGAPAGTATYQSSGLSYDLRAKKVNGAYTQCGP